MTRLVIACLFATAAASRTYTDVGVLEEETADAEESGGGRRLSAVSLTTAEKQFYLDLHNDARAEAAQGNTPGQPAAANMNKLFWDEALAQVASDYAAACVWAHNTDPEGDLEGLSITPFFDISGGSPALGENLYINSGSSNTNSHYAQSSKDGWWDDEHPFYDFATDTCASGEQCGHYTQMAWASTRYVGCGAAICPTVTNLPGWTNAYYVVCNYAPAGNYPTQPYEEGAACSNCNSERTQCSTDGLCAGCMSPYAGSVVCSDYYSNCDSLAPFVCPATCDLSSTNTWCQDCAEACGTCDSLLVPPTTCDNGLGEDGAEPESTTSWGPSTACDTTLYDRSISSKSDYEGDWTLDTSMGSATLNYGNGGMQIKSTASGTSHATATFMDPCGSSFYDITVTLRGRSLENNDQCEFSASTDGGSSWTAPIGTVVNNQDRGSDPDLDYSKRLASEGMGVMLRMSNVAGSSLDRCILIAASVTGTEDGFPLSLYDVPLIDSSADFDGWMVAGGAATVSYSAGLAAMLLKSTAAGTSHATYTIADNTALLAGSFDISLTAAARNLEAPDTCEYTASTDGGSTWTSMGTIVNGQDRSSDPDQIFATNLLSSGNGLMLRVILDANSANDRCLLKSVSVDGLA